MEIAEGKIRKINLGEYCEWHASLDLVIGKKSHLQDFILQLRKLGVRPVKLVFLGERKANIKFSKNIRGVTKIFIENTVERGFSKGFCSVHIFGVSGDISVKSLRIRRKIIGAFLEGTDSRHISLDLSCIHAKRGALKSEITGIYNTLDKTLGHYGLAPASIYRFWNFLPDISKSYLPFNEARDEYFILSGIQKFPAATGIENGSFKNANVCIGLEACAGDGVRVDLVRSKMQCEAATYGPKFSRAAKVSFLRTGLKKIYISGTSSIDKHGKSVFKHDAGKNVAYVMECVQHLLKKSGMGINDVAYAYVYLKNKKAYDEFVSMYEGNGWMFPYNVVFVEICRKDLIFEIECMATNKIGVVRN